VEIKNTKQHDTLTVDNQSKPLNINSKEECLLLLCALYTGSWVSIFCSQIAKYLSKKSGRKKADYQNRRPL